jgi:hypothetical protein
MIGANVGVHNGKAFNQVEIKPEMVRHYSGEFSITYKPVNMAVRVSGPLIHLDSFLSSRRSCSSVGPINKLVVFGLSCVLSYVEIAHCSFYHGRMITGSESGFHSKG